MSPTYVPDLAHATLDLLLDGEAGVWHLANRGTASWYRLALWIAEAFHLDRLLVAARPEPRTACTALASERGTVMPTLDSALGRFLHDAGTQIA